MAARRWAAAALPTTRGNAAFHPDSRACHRSGADRAGMGDDELANEILNGKRRQVRPHRPAQVMDYPARDAAQLVDARLCLRKAVDRLLASGRREDVPAAVPARQRLEQGDGGRCQRHLVRPPLSAGAARPAARSGTAAQGRKPAGPGYIIAVRRHRRATIDLSRHCAWCSRAAAVAAGRASRRRIAASRDQALASSCWRCHSSEPRAHWDFISAR